jgi:hypothetical protein
MDEYLTWQQKLGLSVTGMCTKFTSLVDVAGHDGYVDGLKETIEVCRKMGCKNIISQVGQERTDISREEQHCYELLTSVNGVGPKAAMSILSAGPQNFTLAVMTGDEKLLTAAQGIGKKIAQRIILELKDKIGGSSVELDFSTGPAVTTPAAQGGSVALARAALQELGYSPAEIQAALKGADPNASTEELVRHALRAMVMKS